MTELQNIALIYESSVLLIESKEQRLAYLVNQYTNRFLELGSKPDSNFVCKVRWDYRDTVETPMEKAKFSNFNKISLLQLFELIIRRDPSPQGKYADWMTRQVLNAAQETSYNWNDTVSYILGWSTSSYHHEDEYKLTQDLAVFDQHKSKIPADKRDINKLNWNELTKIVQPILDKLNEAELENVQEDEYIKLVDGLKGWTVVVPLTKKAARKYGMSTRWCTAARKDSDNAFDQYNDIGPLIIFINGDNKFQLHVDLTSEMRIQQHRKIEFRDSQDFTVKYSDVVPQEVWDETIAAMKACDIPNLNNAARDVWAWENGNYRG